MEELKPGTKCPFLGMKDCIRFECALYANMKGIVPATGKEVDMWGCTFQILPHLIMDGANQTRQAGAAIEGLRNQIADANMLTRVISAQQGQSDLPPPPPIIFMPKGS